MSDAVIDAYVNTYSEELSLALLKVLAHPESGGLGYGLVLANPTFEMDGWDVDHGKRIITLDTSGILSANSVASQAEALRNAIETEFLKTRAGFWSRYGWGTGKLVLGGVETVIGVIGIVVPEPGTTAGGVVLVVLGTNTMADGVSQLFGANQGHGYNPLSEAFGAAGAGLADLAGLDRELGRRFGKGTFFVASIALGTWGSIRVLHVPGGTIARVGVGGQKGGVALGRLDMLYPSGRAGDGLTILSINNNANQSFLRFVTHNGQLVVNARIVGQQKLLVHATDGKEILRGLLKLLQHGAKF